MVFQVLAAFLLAGIAGYVWSGCAIVALHRYAHEIKVARCRNREYPISAAIYGLHHLAHHRSIPVETVVCKKRSFSWKIFRIDLNWAVPFAYNNVRWTAIRTLVVYRALQMFALLFCLHFVGLSFISVVIGAGSFLLGAFACLVAYDLCHFWTHAGGLFPSQLHVDHHAKPSGNFGMWRWHNGLGQWNMRLTIRALRHAEWFVSRVPSQRYKLEQNLDDALGSY